VTEATSKEWLLCSAVLCSAVLAWSPAHGAGAAAASPPHRTLRNDHVGYSLSYPRGWKVAGQIVATEFAAGAACQSVRIVDFAPPAVVPSGQVLQSFVQICWKRVRDGSSLDEFMRKTYGRRLSELFRRTSVAATRAYRTKYVNGSTTIFLQTPTYRLQIAAAAVARSAKRDARLAQVQRVLASLAFRR
jgi:hypothetical protein